MRIYVIDHEISGIFKVGISKNTRRRFSEIQNTNRYAKQVSISLYSVNARNTERLVHNILKLFRVRMPGSGGTEWFDIRPAAVLLAFISVFLMLYIDAFYYNFAVSIFVGIIVYFFCIRFVLYLIFTLIFVLAYYKIIFILFFFTLLFLSTF